MSSPDSRSLRNIALAATLRRSRIFSTLSSSDLETVVETCTTRTLEKNQILFSEGDKAEGFFVVQSGQVSVFRVTPDGREQIICVFKPGESFAEVALAATESYPSSAMAIEPSQVIVVTRDRFRDLISKKPELALHMLASMSMHLKHLVQSLHDIKGRQIESRLAEWLLQQGPADQEEGFEFQLPMTKKMLAGQLGVTSETLSRTFARFRNEDLLQVDGPRLRIKDAAGLRAYCSM